MTIEEIRTATAEAVNARISEINGIVQRSNDAAEIETLTSELEALQSRAADINELNERAKRTAAVAAGATPTHIVETGTSAVAARTYDASSAEYRDAFLAHLQGRTMTEVEQRAFSGITTSDNIPMPTTLADEIVDLMAESHPILNDVKKLSSGTAFEVSKRTAITAGDAKVTAEGVANDSEKDTFVKVTLSGKDFSKYVEIGYAAYQMSTDAFKTYLVSEIADRMGAARAADVVAQIKTDMAAANKKQTKAIGSVAFTDVTAAFAVIKHASKRVVYCNNNTLFTQLVGMVDSQERPIYQVNINADAMGALLGAEVHVEDACADGEILIGDPQKYFDNVIQDVMIEPDKDIKAHTYIYSGYARAQGTLTEPEGFASLTVKTA